MRPPSSPTNRPPVRRPRPACPALALAAAAGLLARPARAQLDPRQLPVLAPPHGLAPDTFWAQHAMAFGWGGLAALALAGLGAWSWRRVAAPRVIPTEVPARRELAACAARPEPEERAEEVSRILRRYAADVHELPSGGRTTAELCARLAGERLAGAALAAELGELLRVCDAWKFSPRPPGPPPDLAGQALEWLERVEARRSERAWPTANRTTANGATTNGTTPSRA